ncbi:MAG: ABC transporter ATP-binding protein [Burkholderiaceae bacterium]
MLRLDRVGVRYGPIVALRDVSLTITRGSVTAIVGANGAGKSTLLKAIVGLVPLAAGRLALDDRDLAGWPTERRVAAGIALSPEGRRLFADMSVQHNLVVGAARRDDRAAVKADLARVYRLFPALAHRRRSLGRHLSGGEQQMCAIGRALMAAPRLLLLDEPTLGLAPAVIDDLGAAIREIAAQGVTIVLVEQNSRWALSLAQAGHVLESGGVALSAPAAALLEDPRVARAYLGS